MRHRTRIIAWSLVLALVIPLSLVAPTQLVRPGAPLGSGLQPNASTAGPADVAKDRSSTGGWTVQIGSAFAEPVDNPSEPTQGRVGGTNIVRIRLGATDGWVQMPDGTTHYIFGFVDLTGVPESEIWDYRGKAVLPAPPIFVDEGDELYLTLTNIGMPTRPDLDDSHTVHFHGFPNAIPAFDGAPEWSYAVPVGRSFTYYYKIRYPGTYMYHCHFESTEHIQMGMVGPLVVRPAQDGIDGPTDTLTGKYVYNDGDGSTAYDQEYVMFLHELDSRPHNLIASVQEFDWTDYKPDYWMLNGRSYPDTLLPSGDPSRPQQPVSSLIQTRGGQRVLLRFINLGYEQHAITLPGIRFRVVGEHAKLQRGPGGADLSYWKNTLYARPGESYDLIFAAPWLTEDTTYFLYNRNLNKQTTGSQAPGGMVTEVRVTKAYRTILPAVFRLYSSGGW